MPRVITTDPTEIAVPTLTALGKWAGISGTTLRNWRSNGIVPDEPPYVLSAIFQNHRDREEINRARGKSGRRGVVSDEVSDVKDLQIKKLQEDLALTTEKVREATRKNEADEGELIPADETERAIIVWAHAFRNELQQLPVTLSNLVPSVAKAQTKTIVTDELARVLRQVYESGISTSGESVDDMIVKEAARVEGRRSTKSND